MVLSQLAVTKQGGSHRDKSPGRQVGHPRGRLNPSYDRLATLRFDVVKGEERLATTQVRINAEEGKTRTFATSLRLEAEELDRLFAEGEPALMRVTVTVQDND